jgi:clan AA aspartic protease (TIGR02281 family)
MARLQLIRVLLLSAALVAAAPVSAEVYQWTDANGALSFSDNPSRAPSSQAARVAWLDASQRDSQHFQQFVREDPAHATSASAPLSPNRVVIPFERDGNLMKVQVRLNDRVIAPFYIDTAASGVTVTEQVARDLGLHTGPGATTTEAITANGRVRLPVVELASVELGASRVRGLRGLVNPHLEVGLLGGSFFNQFNYSVDSAEGTIVLDPIRR